MSRATLPSGWEIVKFEEMFDRLTRKNETGNKNVLTISARHGLIKQEEFFNKSVASSDLSNYYLLERGDFAYNKSYSAGYNFGAFKQLTQYDSGVVSPLYICFSVNEKNKCPEFYVHYFESMLLDREVKAFAQEGARNHGLLNISIGDFFSMRLPLPPLHEQKAITKILTTQDILIETKIRLIDEKKQQKRWYIQNLLTGNIRLPGYNEKWKQVRFGDVCTGFNYGLNAAAIRYDGVNKYLRITDIDESSRKFLTNSLSSPAGELHENCLLKENDLIFARTGASVGKTYLYDTSDGKVFYAGYLICCNVRIAYNARFVFGQTFTKEYNKWVKIFSMRSGQPGINAEEYKTYTFLCPPLPEQVAIAERLIAADREIELLTQELEQQKLIKKYLMQQLLTGKKCVKEVATNEL